MLTSFSDSAGNWKSLNADLAPSGLCVILEKDALCDIETAPSISDIDYIMAAVDVVWCFNIKYANYAVCAYWN